MTLRPRKKAWLPLLIVSGPIAAFGVADMIVGEVWVGLAIIAFAAMIVGYNGTIRLTVDAGQMTLKRFGLTVWSAPTQDMTIKTGRGGDVAVLPAYVFMRHSVQVGHVLRGWFAETDIAMLRMALANGS